MYEIVIKTMNAKLMKIRRRKRNNQATLVHPLISNRNLDDERSFGQPRNNPFQ